MVIYRPHRGSLADAMKFAKEFATIEEMLEYICMDHNEFAPWFTITPEELCYHDYGKDERVGWHNCFIVTFERPSKIKNLKGYCNYLGIKEENIILDEPIGVFGMFSTDYSKI